MIENYGGLSIDQNGNRVFPGSGGLVGGLSEKGSNYMAIVGGGKEYHQFTPGTTDKGGVILNNQIEPIGGGQQCIAGLCGDNPQFPDRQTGGGGGTIFPPPPPPPPPPTGTPVTPRQTRTGVWTNNDKVNEVIDSILGAPASTVESQSPFYLFTPGQNGGAASVNWNMILIVGVIVGGGIFAYTKFK